MPIVVSSFQDPVSPIIVARARIGGTPDETSPARRKGDGMTTTLPQAIQPGDAGYDAARAVWNGSIDRRPAAIIPCSSPADVAAAIAAARRDDLPLAVRCGGHSMAGHGTCDGGIVADLRPINHVVVDPAERRVRVGGGALLGEMDAATQEYGLAVPGGHVSHTGVGGLTLGGGIGWLQRAHGLTIDSLESAQVVTADGSVVEASEDVNADLFWGLRGGGGNFGVVTEFRFRAQPVGPVVLAGMLLFTLDRAMEAFRVSRAVVEADERLTVFEVLITAPPEAPFPPELQGRPAMAVGICFTGAIADGEAAVAPLRALGPDLDLLAPMPYVALQQMLDPTAPHGLKQYTRAHWLTSDAEEAVETAIERFRTVPSPLSQLILGRMGGAVARRDSAETAFGHRDAHGQAWIVSSWTGAEDEPHMDWVRETYDLFAPFAKGVYVNALADEDTGRVRAAYAADVWDRLVAVKDRWDPDNVFRLNQNIPPSS
jgi:FAD/FMN-containing dehydrogenase